MAKTEAELKAYEDALKWLRECPRSQEEIADKFVDCINITYDLTTRHHQKDFLTKLFEII